MSKSNITIRVVASLSCPRCGAEELTPETKHLPPDQQTLQIRAFKVLVTEEDGWESECLVCKEAGRPSWFSTAQLQGRRPL